MTGVQTCALPISQIFEREDYDQGDPITFSVHFRNDIAANSSQITAFEPDGDTSSILNVLYQAGGFSTNNSIFYNRTIPDDAEQGKWIFEVVYNTTSYGVLIYQEEFWVAEDCQTNIVHEDPLSIDAYYQASNTITSSSVISNNTHIVYDAENIITLLPGFRALVSSKLEIKTAGCN